MIRPVFSMVVFSTVFGRLAGLPSEGVPYPVFVYSAIVPWGFFTGALSRTSSSLVENAHLITRIYFPRIIIPATAGLAGILDFIVAALAMLVVLMFYGYYPGVQILAVPALLLVSYLMAFGLGICFAALYVRFRDVGFLLSFFIELWMFATPVVYSLDLVPAGYRHLATLNPMAGIIEGYRWALIGSRFPGPFLLISVAATALFLLVGQWYFRRAESTFADVI
jgi:lipopolysaccharide transport system permease protein